MSKKKQAKKHKFKYAAPVIAGQMQVPTVAPNIDSSGSNSELKIARGAYHTLIPQRDFSYVAVDLRRIGILAVSLILLELVIWFIFTHTGVGNSVYSMVQV